MSSVRDQLRWARFHLGDGYILTEGGMRGQRGLFTRDGDGTVTGFELAGRPAIRVPPARG